MRMSTAGMHNASINAILDQQVKMARTQQQLTTGKKFQTASEDPIGATRAAVLDRTLADNAQFERNSNIVETRLNYEEQAMADVTTSCSRCASARCRARIPRSAMRSGACSRPTSGRTP